MRTETGSRSWMQTPDRLEVPKVIPRSTNDNRMPIALHHRYGTSHLDLRDVGQRGVDGPEAEPDVQVYLVHRDLRAALA